MRTISNRKVGLLAGALALLLAGTVLTWWSWQHPVTPTHDGADAPSQSSSSAVIVPPKVVPGTILTEKQLPLPEVCQTQSTEPFTLKSVELFGVGRYDVKGGPLQPIYDAQGNVMGYTLYVPEGGNPSIFGWDTSRGKVGETSIVRLTAHTWNNLDTALGNVAKRTLHRESLIVLRGAKPREVICFRVNSVMNVKEHGAPAKKEKAIARLNGARPDDNAAIVVCSGLRLAPGVYTKRTIFFATKV